MIKQSFIDMEKMFDVLEIEPEIKDSPDADPLQVLLNPNPLNLETETLDHQP
jgi:ABC-type transport system involved in Fe-S cluster assembly fused permease/ATPase subunit